MEKTKDNIVIGAGPAGVSAAYELSSAGKNATIIEKSGRVGGISRTINYKGFHFDLGPHRFFTKYDEVLKLWKKVLGDEFINVDRLTRIYYRNKFFYYPLKPFNALFGVGIFQSIAVLASYLKSQIFPVKNVVSFEDWVSNKFGRKLFNMFFKTYTEKVWGIPTTQIGAKWASQRIKNMNLITAVINALKIGKGSKVRSLTDTFNYPLYGAGYMYEQILEKAKADSDINLMMEHEVVKVLHKENTITGVVLKGKDGQKITVEGAEFISTMPLTEMVARLDPAPPKEVLEAAKALYYRNSVFVNLVIKKEKVFPDNWIYVHSPEVQLGRITDFKNFSIKMVPDQKRNAITLEYFCFESDEIWNMDSDAVVEFAKEELKKLNLLNPEDVEDGFVVREQKTYPTYFIGYEKHLDVIDSYIKKFDNLQIAGRYGMYRYNNMDHSVLTGLRAARNVIAGDKRAYDVYAVGMEEEYIEIA